MDVLYPCCAGLDVHKEVVACARVVSGQEVRKDIETFDTTTEGLLKLSDWLLDGEYERLRYAILSGESPYLWEVVEFAVQTGMRPANPCRIPP